MDPGWARRVEDASRRAWPAHESARVDGWELRATGGSSKRANSVQPDDPSSRPLLELVEECEAWYASRGMPVVFRLTPFSAPGLDSFLEEREYDLVEPTDVFSAPLEPGLTKGARDDVVELELEGWVARYTELSGRAPDTVAPLRATLTACHQPRLFGALTTPEGSDPVGCGMVVLDRDLVGLFNLVTAERYRRRGYGAAMVTGCLHWAVTRGARHAYLQVVRTNAPARALYAKLGFTNLYTYWYRVRE
jgi:N-acetylglutamate synthase